MNTAVATIESPSSLQTYVFSTAQAFENAQRMAIALSKSTLVPKEYANNTANCLIALEIAQRTQSSPLLVMQNLYIVHNKPSWSSQFIIAAINGCGRFRSLRFDKTGGENTDERACVAWTVERNVEVPTDIKTLAQARARNLPVLESPPVSIKMAKEEGWYGKNGSKWKTMPELMLCYRTATFFGRLYAPEILMGMRPQDEVEDMIDVTPQSDSSVLNNLNDAIKNAQKKVHEVDPETGEVIENAAANSSPPEVKPTEPKPTLPTFDINAYNLTAAKDVAQASSDFILVLSVYPADERPAVFLGSSGVMLVQAMRMHGLALDVKKIEGLGISLPPADEQKPSNSKKLFEKPGNAEEAA